MSFPFLQTLLARQAPSNSSEAFSVSFRRRATAGGGRDFLRLHERTPRTSRARTRRNRSGSACAIQAGDGDATKLGTVQHPVAVRQRDERRDGAVVQLIRARP